MEDSGRERRRECRAEFPIALAVRCREPDGTRRAHGAVTHDASSSGLCFFLSRPLAVGQVLDLELPLPRHLRRFDMTSPTYRLYGLVRNVTAQNGGFRIGVMFFGKEPPRGYEERPAARYLLPSDMEAHAGGGSAEEPMSAQRRRHERYEMQVAFRLQALDESGVVVWEEDTVAENISKGGARLKTSFGLEPGDAVLLRDPAGLFQSRGVVRNSYVGDDRVRRINLMFLDSAISDRLIRSH